MLQIAYDSNDEPIDTRETFYIALTAVIKAYVEGRIQLSDLTNFHCWGVYNGHKLKAKFGDHPLFDVESSLSICLAEFQGPDDWKAHCKEIHGITYDEAYLRDSLRKLIGVGITTGSSANLLAMNIIYPPNATPVLQK